MKLFGFSAFVMLQFAILIAFAKANADVDQLGQPTQQPQPQTQYPSPLPTAPGSPQEWPILVNFGTPEKPDIKYVTPAYYQVLMNQNFQKNSQASPPPADLPAPPPEPPRPNGVSHGKDKVVIVTETEIDIPKLREEISGKKQCVCRKKEVLIGQQVTESTLAQPPTAPFPSAPAPRFPSAPAPRFPSAPAPRFPSAPEPRFPSAPEPFIPSPVPAPLQAPARLCPIKTRQYLQAKGCKRIVCKKSVTQRSLARVGQVEHNFSEAKINDRVSIQ